MKQVIRSFAFGLLTAGIIMLGVFYLTGDSRADADNISTDDMIEHIEQKGYHVLTEPEYIAASVESDNSDKAQKDKKNKNKSNDKKKTYTLNVKSDTATAEISEELAKHDIVNDPQKFSDYLEKESYSKQIQLGKFKLSSDMSREKVAKTLTQ